MSSQCARDKICAVCGSADLKALYPVTDTNQGVEGKWSIVACQQCGLGVLSPFPRPEDVAGFYKDQFYTGEGQRFRGWMESLRSWLAYLRGRTLNRLAPSKGRLMDFGSGAGHFATSQASQGWDVVALDPYSSASNTSEYWIDGEKLTINSPDEAFDAITLWYVVEHLSDPRAVIRELRRVTKRGGMLVLAQQDFASIQARVFGSRWLFLDPPRHLWQFTIGSLSDLARQEGYEVVAIERSSIEMGPFTILQSALNCVVGNNNYLFKLLKSRDLRAAGGASGWRTVVSVVLLPILGPMSLIAYFALLALKSGDIFVLYCRRK